MVLAVRGRLELDPRREVDRLIHELVHVEYKACPAAWRAVKAKLQDDEDALAELLRTSVKPKLR